MIDVGKDELISLHAVAIRLDVSYRTVLEWVRRDHRPLEVVRRGKWMRTTWDAVNECMDRPRERTNEQRPAPMPVGSGHGHLSPATLAAAARHGVLLG